MRAVLITGASTGIGRATALWLDRKGWTVFPCVRRDDDAASLAEEGSDRMKPLILDVVDQVDRHARDVNWYTERRF